MLCVDEKTQIQALDRTAPILPLMPGTPQRRTHDYRRHGTTNLFAALDTASGNVITSMTARHRSEEFRKFLNLIDKEVPSHLDVHVVLDNVSTHKTPAVKRWLIAHPRFKLHFTPTYSSWMNLVERWFSELTTKWLRRGTHTSVKDLKKLNQHLGRQLEPGPQTLHMAQNRRPDTRQPRLIYPANSPDRTLAGRFECAQCGQQPVVLLRSAEADPHALALERTGHQALLLQPDEQVHGPSAHRQIHEVGLTRHHGPALLAHRSAHPFTLRQDACHPFAQFRRGLRLQ